MGKREVVKNVFGYFHQDPGSANLAKFSLVGGATERKLHRLMVASLAPFLDPTIDCIILAEGDSKLVDNFRNFVYCGK